MLLENDLEIASNTLVVSSNDGLCGKSGGFGPGDAVDIEKYRCTSLLGSATREHSVSGLDNDVEYRFGVVALDEALNPSLVSNVVCATPENVRSFFDDYSEAGGKGSGFCFIATAAYGSYDHPNVKVFRQFRDQFLARIPSGQSIIQTYYNVGPKLASYISTNRTIKAFVRVALVPLLGLVLILLFLGPTGSLLAFGGTALLGAAAIVTVRRRRRRLIR